ncbi:putative signal transducing protein [Aquimarina pacifica]|uniref:hypothetical protein n=1 Tax=Aquimarina pacifica TaxID=1296415 RepID=UPI00046EF7E1|nr:hypothetical protein [Aquimarina pacifica]
MNEMFATVAVFQYSSEALILRGRLETEGIDVYMTDMHTIDTDPLVSNAIGGVKIKVRSEDKKKALEIIDGISKYVVDDLGYEIECPNCKSKTIEYFTTITSIKSFFAFVFGFLFGGLPFYKKYEYRCAICNTKFNQK